MATSEKLRSSKFDESDAIYDFSCSPCSEDGVKSEALFRCIICQMFYCQICVDTHNKFTKNHDVIDRASKNFGQGQTQRRVYSSSAVLTEKCKEHPEEVIKMFCAEHDLVCCSICIALKHRSCDGVEYIPSIARKEIEKLDKRQVEADEEKVKNDLQTLKFKLQTNLTRLDRNLNKSIDDIQNFKKRLIARVEELEKKSLEELKRRHKEVTEDISHYNLLVEDTLEDLDNIFNDTRHSTTDNEAQTFVGIKLGIKQLSLANAIVRRTNGKTFGELDIQFNYDIETRLRDAGTFGKCSHLTARTRVDVVVPVKTGVTDSFYDELQRSIASSEKELNVIESGEIIIDGCTIVVCEYWDSNKVIENIEKVLPDLPIGWEMRGNGDGRYYYVDHTTKKTSWYRPTRQDKAKARIILIQLKDKKDDESSKEQRPMPSYLKQVLTLYYSIDTKSMSVSFKGLGNEGKLHSISVMGDKA